MGFSRTPFSDEAWREHLGESTARSDSSGFDKTAWEAFASCLHYHPGDISESNDFHSLAKRLNELEQEPGATRIYYLATAPRFYEPAITQLGSSGLAAEDGGGRRVVIEKPFGARPVECPAA